MSAFFNAEDGYYSITKTGIITLIVLIAVLVILTAFISSRGHENTKKKSIFSTKQLVFCAVLLALGFTTSFVKIIRLPLGGSVTLCSMLFITLIGYWYGPKIGLICGVAYSILQFIQDGGSYVLSPLQACLDFFFAFTALGVSGFFYKKKNGLYIGYIVAILARGLFHTLGGYLYWMDYMPESFPKSLSFIYPFVYNYSFILLEGIITIIILLLPPVKKALSSGKKLANQ